MQLSGPLLDTKISSKTAGMQEEEAHQEEAISQGREEEEGDADVEMMEELMEEEERENGEPSEPQGVAETEEVPPGFPRVMPSLPRKMPSSCNRHPNQ